MPLINTADAVYVGDTLADRAYVGDTLVWEAAEPVADLFADGFEGAAPGTNWTVTTGAGLTLETAAPIAGAKSMRYTHDGVRTTGYVEKTWTALTGAAYAQVVIDLDVLVADNANSLHRLVQLNGPFANLEFGHGATPANGYELKGNGAWVGTTGLVLTQGQRLTVTVYYKPGTGANGEAAWWVDGTQIMSTTSHAQTATVTGLKVGNLFANQAGLGSGTSFLFDSVRVNTTPLPLS